MLLGSGAVLQPTWHLRVVPELTDMTHWRGKGGGSRQLFRLTATAPEEQRSAAEPLCAPGEEDLSAQSLRPASSA
jgi:hypothetical protein